MAVVCGRCLRSLSGSVYEVRSEDLSLQRCLRCLLMFRPLVFRSAVICAIAGTLLVAVNQGNVMLKGEASLELAWKIPLTYAVPYLVATAGAVLNARTSSKT